MAKIAYQPMRFSPDRIDLVERCNEIIEEYLSDGLKLTLRQLYYQLVSRDLLPNRQQEYKRLGDVVNNARLAGLIDWEAIEDRTRNLDKLSHWDTPEDIIQACAFQFRLDRWEAQEVYPEVWIEKEALAGVFERICRPLDVPFFACRGYTSQSEMWGAGKRFVDRIEAGKRVVVFHFGDHDPSGIDMTRDIEDRLRLFVEYHTSQEEAEAQLEIRRLALNMDQVRRYRPPENPAKTTDSRFSAYRDAFGDKSWELDALNPRTLADLVRENVMSVCDEDLWKELAEREAEHKALLRATSRKWPDVEGYLRKSHPGAIKQARAEGKKKGEADE